MTNLHLERRQVQRVTLLQNLPARCGSMRLFVADVSVTGLRVLHQEPFPAGTNTISFSWDGLGIVVGCTVARSIAKREARSQFEKPLYESGMLIVSASETSMANLRTLVEAHVVRALDEQKANARGIPATAAQSFQTGAATDFVRHELVNGTWRERRTSDRTQPLNGFTIAANETPQNIARLRSAFETADDSMRRMMRKFAELSISSSDGIPTRRFIP